MTEHQCFVDCVEECSDAVGIARQSSEGGEVGLKGILAQPTALKA